MRKYLAFLAIFLLASASAAWATPVLVGGTPDLPAGTFQAQQDNADNVNWIAQNLNGEEYTLELVEKIDIPDTSGEFFSLELNGKGNAGTWNSSYGDIQYVSVKAGSTQSGGGFALYYYEDAVSAGLWDTSALRNKGLSHISFWRVAGSPETPTDPANPTPEPGTLILLGAGLAGVVALRRRQK